MKLSRIKLIFETMLKTMNFIFHRDITLFASSLSFYTILTIVPLLIATLSLISSLSIFSEQSINIQKFILMNIVPVETATITEYIAKFSTNSTQTGLIGFGTMFVSSILFFINFEDITSRIFKIEHRSLLSSIKTYFLLVTITPTILILAMSLQIFLSHHLNGVSLTLVSIFPFLMLWAMFFIIYKIAVNSKILFSAALASSFVVTTTWIVAKMVFIKYVFYNNIQATVYGSLSVFIFFFLWIYLSWIITIYGMKLCYTLNSLTLRKRLNKQNPKIA